MKKLIILINIILFFAGNIISQNVAITDDNTFTVPQSLLHLYKNNGAGTIFQITNATTGNGATDGLQFYSDGTNFRIHNLENGYLSLYTNGTERLRIGSTGFSAFQANSYMNFGGTLGFAGYGFRDNAGNIEYKNSGGSWSSFPAPPTIPGNVEYWIRPTATNYIRPEFNAAVRVYDDGETYGYYYNGSTNLIAGYFRTTNSTNGACAVQGFSDVAGNQTYGYLGYNGSITVGTSTIGGSAVFGNVPDPSRTAVYGKTSGSATVAALLGYSSVWMANYNYVDNTSSIMNPKAEYSQLNVASSTLGGDQEAILGYSNYTAGSGNSGTTYGVSGIAVGASQNAAGVFGLSSTSGSANSLTAGGFFYAENSYWGDNAYAYVADEWNLRKITGTGAVSEIIPTKNHGRITMTCPEAPEYWYYDYGTIKLENGKAHVELDPILIDIIVVDENNPLKVFLQVNIPICEGVSVINKTSTSFDLIENNGGSHSGEIDYQIVVKPKTLYGEGRFVQAPGPAYLKPDQEPKQAKAKNQRNKEKIFVWPSDYKVYNYNPEDFVKVGDVIPAGPNAGKVKLSNGKYRYGLPADRKELEK